MRRTPKKRISRFSGRTQRNRKGSIINNERTRFATGGRASSPRRNITPGIQGRPGMANYGKSSYGNVMGWVLNCGSSVVDGIACGTPGTEDWVDGGEVEYGGTTCTSTSQDCNQPASPNGNMRIKGSRRGVGKPYQNGAVTACECNTNSDCNEGLGGRCVHCRCRYTAHRQIGPGTNGHDHSQCPPYCQCPDGSCKCFPLSCY